MWDGSTLGGAPLVYDVCMSLDMGVCASSGSVGFWPIIPASSQVTAQFSRTYLAFLPRHDYHTPSTPVLAMWNISIIPEWNWSQVSEMNGSPQHPFTHSSLSHPCTLFPFRPTVSRSYYSPPAQIPAVLQLESSGPNPLPPESAVCVCRRDRVIWQRHLFGDLLLGWGRKGRDGGDKSWTDERSSHGAISLLLLWLPLFCLILHAEFS